MKWKPLWAEDGRDWPHRSASQFLRAGGLSWHVQVMGQGPVLLMIHGTGAASHSWRDLAPLLSEAFTIVAPDLPGHGFTELPDRRRLSLPGLAAALSDLVHAMGIEPAGLVGHSAGAAIALRMVLDGAVAPRRVVSLNGALAPFGGAAAILYPALAKLLFLNPFAAAILARRAVKPEAVRRLIEGTGSMLDARGLDLYGRLFRTEQHVEATLAMMANWDLRPLRRELPRLSTPLTLIAAERDRAVPPAVARETMALVPGATLVSVAGAGHLAHEEMPAVISEMILDACAEH